MGRACADSLLPILPELSGTLLMPSSKNPLNHVIGEMEWG
jgi:hypothetical protein